MENDLSITMVGFPPFSQTIELNERLKLNVTMKEEINALNAAVVTAGTFEASDRNKMVDAKTDIATTAARTADITR
jgi:hypothetical protein